MEAVRVPQQMQYPDDYERVEWRGHSKGIKVILEERGLWHDGLLLDCALCKAGLKDDKQRHLRHDCCARRLLASQPDFRAQVSMLEETCKKLGFDVIFLPKFHCEINYIEYLWGFSKRIVRARYPTTLDELKLLVSQSLAACDVSTIRRWERRMWKFIDLYSCDKMTGPLAAAMICGQIVQRSPPHPSQHCR